jgi:hypothetical protein
MVYRVMVGVLPKYIYVMQLLCFILWFYELFLRSGVLEFVRSPLPFMFRLRVHTPPFFPGGKTWYSPLRNRTRQPGFLQVEYRVQSSGPPSDQPQLRLLLESSSIPPGRRGTPFGAHHNDGRPDWMSSMFIFPFVQFTPLLLQRSKFNYERRNYFR